MHNLEKPIHFMAVYYLESTSVNMNPIAIRPEIMPPHYISWEDTSNGRIIRFSKILINGQAIQSQIDTSPNEIEFISQNNETFKLLKLTLKIFNEKLKSIVAGGASLNFNSDQELQDYYLKANF